MIERKLSIQKSLITSSDQSVQSDSILLSGYPWPINGDPDSNLESHYIITQNFMQQ
jgi:hypothetical protein